MLHPIWRQRNMALGDAARTKQRDRVSAIREIPDRPELAELGLIAGAGIRSTRPFERSAWDVIDRASRRAPQ